MPQSASFDDVISRLHKGDKDAAAELFRHFAGRLVALARSRLSPRVRGKVDPEDVLQSVFRSFFVREAENQFELKDWDSLWSLLVRITLRKCGREIAASRADCRDVRRETSLAVGDDDSCRRWEAVARDPTPQEAAILTETLEGLMHGLDEGHRRILALRLQGYTILEISREVERTERTVQRVLSHVREGLKRIEGGSQTA
jgi:RNA polymerase sigma-70 factor (ECF subfamily)